MLTLYAGINTQQKINISYIIHCSTQGKFDNLHKRKKNTYQILYILNFVSFTFNKQNITIFTEAESLQFFNSMSASY